MRWIPLNSCWGNEVPQELPKLVVYPSRYRCYAAFRKADVHFDRANGRTWPTPAARSLGGDGLLTLQSCRSMAHRRPAGVGRERSAGYPHGDAYRFSTLPGIQQPPKFAAYSAQHPPTSGTARAAGPLRRNEPSGREGQGHWAGGGAFPLPELWGPLQPLPMLTATSVLVAARSRPVRAAVAAQAVGISTATNENALVACPPRPVPMDERAAGSWSAKQRA